MVRKSLEKKLIGNMDGKVWAEEFVKMVKKKSSIATDEGTMIGWFANAIMAGYDSPNNINKQKVKEVIDKYIDYTMSPAPAGTEKILFLIKKELGIK